MLIVQFEKKVFASVAQRVFNNPGRAVIVVSSCQIMYISCIDLGKRYLSQRTSLLYECDEWLLRKTLAFIVGSSRHFAKSWISIIHDWP